MSEPDGVSNSEPNRAETGRTARQELADKNDRTEYPHNDIMRRVSSDETLPLTRHLEELRWRLIYCAVTILAAFLVLYSFSAALFDFLRAPMGEFQIISIAPAEAFFAYLKVSFYSALVVSTPMILYQTWEFVAPGLLNVERRYTGVFVVCGTTLFAIGAGFCFQVALPLGLQFLLGFASDSVTPQITVSNYISFMFTLLIAFGMIFQLPVVLIMLTRLGVVTPETLADKRAYFIVSSFIVAALLTPPDVFTQAILAAPMILLYEVSLLLSRLFVKKREETNE